MEYCEQLPNTVNVLFFLRVELEVGFRDLNWTSQPAVRGDLFPISSKHNKRLSKEEKVSPFPYTGYQTNRLLLKDSPVTRCSFVYLSFAVYMHCLAL